MCIMLYPIYHYFEYYSKREHRKHVGVNVLAELYFINQTKWCLHVDVAVAGELVIELTYSKCNNYAYD